MGRMWKIDFGFRLKEIFVFQAIAIFIFFLSGRANPVSAQEKVPEKVMKEIYEKVKTPFKYGLVLVPENPSLKFDSPSVFHHLDSWYMTYIVFNGRGYETWTAKSNDLLNWETQDRILSFSEGGWDANQKAGYIALQDYNWGGSYELQKYDNKYWMTYLGGDATGYETGKLGVGIAFCEEIGIAKEWQTLSDPVLSVKDNDVRWYDSKTIYKSSVIWDKKETLGYPFVMYYNAKGSNTKGGMAEAERISMAVSNDMISWKRFGNQPVIDHRTGISGDAVISKIDDIWVLFYFGAFWKPGAFDRFACSYDLVNWTDWTGEDLIYPTQDYDRKYAHKPFVIYQNGIVYHFYCAVDENNNRGIALATSVDMGKSNKNFKRNGNN